MKLRQVIGSGVGILALLMSLAPLGSADVGMRGGQRTSLPSIKSADDAVSNLPVISRIPKSFLIGDGFKFKLSADSLRIDHMGFNSKAPANKRTCMVGFSFSSPVAFFGSSIEIPIFYSENIHLSNWSANTPGDYVVHLSKDAAVRNPTVGLSATARF